MLRGQCWGQGQVRSRRAGQEGIAVVQERDDGGLDKGGSSEYDKWSDYGHF